MRLQIRSSIHALALLGTVLAFALAERAAAHEGESHAEYDYVVHTPAEERRLERQTEAITAPDAAAAAATPASVDPAVAGQWGPVVPWPVVGVHVALLESGKVLAHDSIGDLATEAYPDEMNTTSRATVWDPEETDPDEAHTPASMGLGFNIFCNGLAHLADGTVYAAGGNKNQALQGIVQTHIFDGATNTWSREADMAEARWYPSVTPLRNGEMLITEGGPNMPEIRETDGEMRSLTTASQELSDYPWIDVAPDGRAFYSGPNPTMRSLDPSGTGTWEEFGDRDSETRDYGSRAYYDTGKILVSGGGDSLRTARVIDLNGPTPQVSATAPMAEKRRQHNLTVLADGEVLATGGNTTGVQVDIYNGVYDAEMWNPDTGQWRTLAPMARSRQYHSTALLLPDGRVLSAGGGVCGPCDTLPYLEKNAEIFSPPYLFEDDGSGDLAPRPEVTFAPRTVSYGDPFSIATPDPGSVGDVALTRLGAVTHSVNMDQRYVPLSFDQAQGTITADAPANANIAPPGVYMLFVMNSDGVPSIAEMVHVADTAPPPPAVTIQATIPVSPANENFPEVRGSDAEPGSTVRIYSTSNCSGQPIATGPATAFNGPGGITTNVPRNAPTALSATATNAAGEASACSLPLSYVEDSSAPATPSIGATNPASPGNDNSPGVRGSAEPESTVRIYSTSNCSGQPLGSGTATAFNGSAGVTISVSANSSTSLRATATDAAGNPSACSTAMTYVEDSIAPATPSISATDPVSPAGDNNPEVRGSGAEPGSTVRIYSTSNCSGQSLGSGSAAAFNGSGGVTVGVSADSSTSLRATATDDAGNSSACSNPLDYLEDSTAPATPSIGATSPVSPANDNSPKVRGSGAEAGSTVRIYSTSNCSGQPLSSGTAAAFNGSAGVTVSLTGDSSTALRATAADAAGNSSPCSPSLTYVEDSIAPAIPSISATSPTSPANDNSPKVSGSGAEAGSRVRIYSTADCSGSPIGDGTAAEFNGSAGIAANVADDSATPLRARATDAAGNGSGCSAALVYVEDSTLPPAPTLLTTDPISPANDNAPALRGIGAELGSTVRVYSTSDCSGAPLATGAALELVIPGILAPVPGDQATDLRATVTDVTGNSSACSAPLRYIEDSTAPETSAAMPSVAAGGSATISFNSEPDARFQCSFDGAAFAGCTSPVTYSGVAVGGHAIEVRAIDAAGNVDATPARRTFTIEAVPPPPAPPIDEPPAGEVPPVDVTPPNTEIAVMPKRVTRERDARFRFVSTEAASTFACVLDGRPKTCGGTLELSAKLGRHTLTVAATDEAGNSDPVPAAYSWTVKRKRR